MTGRTHDLAAFTALNFVFLNTTPIPDVTLATTLTALGANMIGGLLPDIDNATSDIWDKIRGGNMIAKIVKPFVGKHRMFSHSLLGLFVVSFLLNLLLKWMGTFVLVDMEIIWWSVMIGIVSHLITDGMTKQGIPLLFPLPFDFGFPPFKFLRMKTGGFFETWVIFPGLVILNGYLIYQNYEQYLTFVKGFF